MPRDNPQPRPTLTLPPAPLSVGRLALSLTGYAITGFTGITESVPTVLDPASGVVPRGPYTITDEAGNVLHHLSHVPHWLAERWVVRHWRQRAEASMYCLTAKAATEQRRLAADIRALEVHIAALEARRVAIDVAHGCEDISSLDSSLEAYAKAVEAHGMAVYDIDCGAAMERAA